MEVKITNVYGFNYCKGQNKIFAFDDNTKTHFIYGTNASGKSSFSKSIDLISKGVKYEKVLQEDADTYKIELKYDNINVSIDENFNSDLSQYKERIFVYNKNYIKEGLNFNISNQVIEIGSRISELRKASSSNEKYKNNVLDNIQKKLKDKLQLSTLNGKTLTPKKSITKYVTGKEKGNVELISGITELVDYELYSKLKINDLINDNISNFQEINRNIETITNEVVAEISEKGEGYNIESTDDLSFYNRILLELDRKHYDNCPICLNKDFNQADIINKIKLALKKIENKSNFNFIVEKLGTIKDSYFGNEYNEIINEMLNGNLNMSSINALKEELKRFDEQYDSIILKYIDYTLDKAEYNQYLDNIKKIDEIIEENKNNDNDNFIDNFNCLLKKLFGEGSQFTAQKMSEKVNGEILYSIQLRINDVLKEGVSISVFFDKVLSESQKARISLAYYFASIISKPRADKLICIFDDPLDSYDSNGKYIICRELKDFCEKNNFYKNFNYDSQNIILSHSVDFLRIIQLFKVKWKFHVLNSFSLVEIAQDDLYVFDGDPNILIHKLDKKKEIDINEMIPLTAILRSVCSDITKILCINDNNKNNILVGSNNKSTQQIQKDLSNRFIHGWFKSDKFKLDEYVDYFKTNCNIVVTGTDNSVLNTDIFSFMKTKIENDKDKSLKFIDELFFKNYISLYVRSYVDGRLVQEIIKYVKDENGNQKYSQEDDVYKDLLEISVKANELYKNIMNVPSGEDMNRVQKLLDFVYSNRVLLNEFAHSENAFVSPVIDVKTEELLTLYNQIGKL